MKQVLQNLLGKLGLRLSRTRTNFRIPDRDLYRPYYSPWYADGKFQRYYEMAKPKTVVTIDRYWVLYTLVQQALHVEGNIWECGVYKGGTAALFARVINDANSSKKLYLFDTFQGMPDIDSTRDLHEKGDFLDTSVKAVVDYVGYADLCVVREGFIPDTFKGLESEKIAFAHIDVDIYQSILDCLTFIWPRISTGGFVVFDDYGLPTCPGARAAVDEFFERELCIPLCLATGQAIVFKSMS